MKKTAIGSLLVVLSMIISGIMILNTKNNIISLKVDETDAIYVSVNEIAFFRDEKYPDNLLELEAKSKYILKVKILTYEQPMDLGCVANVEVLKVYKGKSVNEKDVIRLKEPIRFDYFEGELSVTIHTHFGLMYDEQEYIVFLESIDENDLFNYTYDRLGRFHLKEGKIKYTNEIHNGFPLEQPPYDEEYRYNFYLFGRNSFELDEDYERYKKYLESVIVIGKSVIEKYAE